LCGADLPFSAPLHTEPARVFIHIFSRALTAAFLRFPPHLLSFCYDLSDPTNNTDIKKAKEEKLNYAVFSGVGLCVCLLFFFLNLDMLVISLSSLFCSIPFSLV
jgi:hypothetical protein